MSRVEAERRRLKGVDKRDLEEQPPPRFPIVSVRGTPTRFPRPTFPRPQEPCWIQGSPLTDSNRRPPPYHVPLECRSWLPSIANYLQTRLFEVGRFATDHRRSPALVSTVFPGSALPSHRPQRTVFLDLDGTNSPTSRQPSVGVRVLITHEPGRTASVWSARAQRRAGAPRVNRSQTGFSKGSETRLTNATRRAFQGAPERVTRSAATYPTMIPASTSLG